MVSTLSSIERRKGASVINPEYPFTLLNVQVPSHMWDTFLNEASVSIFIL